MISDYSGAFADISTGVRQWDMWGRIGWREIKRRYRRTVIGPFWTTLSLALFVVVLGLVWSRLWNQDPKTYLPFLTAGMIVWVLISTIATEGSAAYFSAESLIKQLRVSYTLLAFSVVWRNVVVFLHNLAIYAGVCLYASVSIGWPTLLLIPGLILLWINSVWIVMVLGMACARFRDIQQLVTSVFQVLMFLTPIYWSPDQLQGRITIIVDANVLYHYVEIVRTPMLGRAPATLSWIVVLTCTVLGWALALLLFSRFRRRLPYWI
ncbi:MAG: ABC transporter permease [Rhodospirillales bacterium]